MTSPRRNYCKRDVEPHGMHAIYGIVAEPAGAPDRRAVASMNGAPAAHYARRRTRSRSRHRQRLPGVLDSRKRETDGLFRSAQPHEHVLIVDVLHKRVLTDSGIEGAGAAALEPVVKLNDQAAGVFEPAVAGGHKDFLFGTFDVDFQKIDGFDAEMFQNRGHGEPL